MAVLPESLRSSMCAYLGGVVEAVVERPLQAGTGAATGSVVALVVRVRTAAGEEAEARLVRKTLRPLNEGRHAGGARDPRHWAYWRREADAYESGLLPSGPGLRSPRCFGVDGTEVFLELVEGPAPSVAQAAAHLSSWQERFRAELDRPWMARDQLGQRLAVTELDWSAVDVDPRVVRLWERRWELYDVLRSLPVVRSHGDYSIGNLIEHDGDTVTLDWAAMGWEPAGFDLAHLALSTGQDPTDAYVAESSLPPATVQAGYQAAVQLIGASRMHWMLTHHIEVPTWYADFVLGD